LNDKNAAGQGRNRKEDRCIPEEHYFFRRVQIEIPHHGKSPGN
jgi:hypothetical protein